MSPYSDEIVNFTRRSSGRVFCGGTWFIREIALYEDKVIVVLRKLGI